MLFIVTTFIDISPQFSITISKKRACTCAAYWPFSRFNNSNGMSDHFQKYSTDIEIMSPYFSIIILT